jgi:hypothetical protein
MFTRPGQEQDGTAFTRPQRGMSVDADGAHGADFYAYPIGASARDYDTVTIASPNPNPNPNPNTNPYPNPYPLPYPYPYPNPYPYPYP